MIDLFRKHIAWRFGSLDHAFRIARRGKEHDKAVRYRKQGCNRCGRKVPDGESRCTFCRALCRRQREVGDRQAHRTRPMLPMLPMRQPAPARCAQERSTVSRLRSM